MKGIIADFTKEKDIMKVGAMSDVLLRTVDEEVIILQMLQHHEKNINMGLDDTHAPYFHDGVQHYIDHGYTVGTRNSGGRSVANDLGVLNFSLILQNNKSAGENYMMFFDFLSKALKPLNLNFDVGQVDGAYCPGKFDISIDGKKVAGTAQRRIGNRMLVGCYLSVNGDQKKRSQIISDFYKITQDNIEVFPEKHTTLQDQMNQRLEVETVKQYLIDYFKKMSDTHEYLKFDSLDQNAIQSAITRAQNQNTKYLNR